MLEGNRDSYLTTFRLDCGWQILVGMASLKHYNQERIILQVLESKNVCDLDLDFSFPNLSERGRIKLPGWSW